MPPESDQLSLKVVIRCRDFAASRRFYGELLGLPVMEEWEEKGGRGCIFAFSGGGSLEIYQMTVDNKRCDPSFERAFQDDKIDLQLRTGDLDAWSSQLEGQWPFQGPKTLPRGAALDPAARPEQPAGRYL